MSLPSFVSAASLTDSFDTNPYNGSWSNQIMSAMWDSINGELDLSNDNFVAIKYNNSPGGIDHEAQVTALAFNQDRLIGPGVRFDSAVPNTMYGTVFQLGAITLYRYNAGVSTLLADIPTSVTFTPGHFYSMRMSASGSVGQSVVLSVWIADHGTTKPSDPGWIGNDSSPTATFTDSAVSGTRLDSSTQNQTGIAGRGGVIEYDHRHDYFKTRLISDRTGSSTPTPVPSPAPTPSPTPSPTPTSPSPSSFGSVFFSDDFEYDISRSATSIASYFTNRGWFGVKAINNGATGSGGYMYTRNDSTLGSRVLVMESLPSLNPVPGWSYGQTDYYLQLGSESGTASIPGNVWIQFWTYATPESRFAPRDKVIYPCKTYYPCSVSDLNWLFMWGRAGNQPNIIGENDFAPADQRYLAVRVEGVGADNRLAPEYPSGASNLWQNLNTSTLLSGHWYLVKMHFDTSGSQGIWEAWIRERVASNWTKVAEWIGGVTPQFFWPIPVADRGNHAMIRIPTTVNGNYGDSTTYMDDFVMAQSESALPVYNFFSSATPLQGDLNLDHSINSLDWSIMNSQWFTGNTQSDLRVDGQVNSLDFAILSSNWGRTW